MTIDAEDLDRFLQAPLNQQVAAAESMLEKMEEEEFEIIDALCRRIVKRLQYNNIRARIEYSDGLELLVKLGIFLSLVDKNGSMTKGHDKLKGKNNV
jgi:hypothetical protein